MPVTLMAAQRKLSHRTGSYGLFGQDEMTLAENWRLTLGLRMDHNEFTGWESQPDARLSWLLAPGQTLWGAVSKASRAPSRGEHGMTFSSIEGSIPLPTGLTLPNVVHVLNNGEYSEQLTATQLGLRSQWTSTLTTDAVLFSHKYGRIGGFDTAAAHTIPHVVGNNPSPDYFESYVNYVNLGELTLNGAELYADWHPAQHWYLRFSQTWQSVVSMGDMPVDSSGGIPGQITSLHASWSPTSVTDISLWLRRTGDRPGSTDGLLVDARHAWNSIDLSATWKLQKNLEVSLMGQNLNDGTCDAYTDLPGAKIFPMLRPSCMPRSLSAQVRLSF